MSLTQNPHKSRKNSAPGEDVFEKARTARFSQVLPALGIQTHKNKFLCPIHEADGQEHTPSADYNDDKGLWKCRACHGSHDHGKTVIDLVMTARACTNLEAANWICESVLHQPANDRPNLNVIQPLADASEPKKPAKIYTSPEDAAASLSGHTKAVYYYAEDKAVIRSDIAPGEKTIIPLTRNQAGRWEMKKAGGPWPLYGLHGREILPGQTIVICEGEKCADEINRSKGQYVGVTSQGGSKAANAADWATLPAGHPIAIWPDHDKPGQEYATQVIEELEKACRWPAEGATIIEPPQNWPAKHDASDELRELTATQADSRIHEVVTKYGKPLESPTERLAQANADRLHELGMVKAETIDTQPVSWLIKGVMARGELSLICGEAGSGKTKVAIARAAYLTTGQPIDGLPIEGGPQHVAIISFEEDPGRMIRPVAEHSGMNLARAFIYDPEKAKLTTLDELDEYLERLAKAGVSYVLIDSLTALYARMNRDIIDTKAPYEVHGAINKAARKYNLCIELIHHYGKASGKSHDNHNKSAGSFAITASVRLVNQVEVDKATGTRFLGVSPTKNNLGLRPKQVLAFRTAKVREDLNSGEGYIIADIAGWNVTETIEDIAARLTQAQNEHIRGQVKPRHIEAADLITSFIEARGGVCRAKELDAHLLNAGYTEKVIRTAKSTLPTLDRHRHPDRQKLNGEYYLTTLSKADALDAIRKAYEPDDAQGEPKAEAPAE